MHVIVHLSVGGVLDLPTYSGDLAAVRQALSEGFASFPVDGATVLVNRDHIVRIEVPQTTAPTGVKPSKTS